jgi:hypothetical protein
MTDTQAVMFVIGVVSLMVIGTWGFVKLCE